MCGEADGTAAAVRELTTALERIDETRLDPASREALQAARAAAWALTRELPCAEAPPLVDRTRYRRLIEIAGPEGSQELLERLSEDLRQVERGLRRALGADPSLTEVRAQTHVLVSLAGAVGAVPLQRLAEALNAAAHDAAAQDAATREGALAEIEQLGALTLNKLALLSHFIAAEEAAGPTAA